MSPESFNSRGSHEQPCVLRATNMCHPLAIQVQPATSTLPEPPPLRLAIWRASNCGLKAQGGTCSPPGRRRIFVDQTLGGFGQRRCTFDNTLICCGLQHLSGLLMQADFSSTTCLAVAAPQREKRNVGVQWNLCAIGNVIGFGGGTRLLQWRRTRHV